MRVAIASAGKPGLALAARMNRTTPDGENRYAGITVIRPRDSMTGRRWDAIIVLPPPQEASQGERDEYSQWCREELPLKLAGSGEIIRL